MNPIELDVWAAIRSCIDSHSDREVLQRELANSKVAFVTNDGWSPLVLVFDEEGLLSELTLGCRSGQIENEEGVRYVEVKGSMTAHVRALACNDMANLEVVGPIQPLQALETCFQAKSVFTTELLTQMFGTVAAETMVSTMSATWTLSEPVRTAFVEAAREAAEEKLMLKAQARTIRRQLSDIREKVDAIEEGRTANAHR